MAKGRRGAKVIEESGLRSPKGHRFTGSREVQGKVVLLVVACVAASGSSRTPTDSAGSEGPVPGSATDTAADTAPDTAAEPLTGPCATYVSAVVLGPVQDGALDEISGLAVSRQNPGILWTHEDSGGAADLYALDSTGATVATLHLEGVTNNDWEDVAIGPCDVGWCLAVGEIGTASWDHSVLIVEEPQLDGAAEYTALPEVRSFTYPGDPEDAEGLALFPDGTSLIVTKRTDATAGLFQLQDDATVLEWLGDVPTGGEGEDLTARATAVDLSTDGTTLLLRTYLHLYEVDVTDPRVPGVPRAVPFAVELQGEAVAYDPLQGGFWQVGEGSKPSLFFTGCG